VGREKGLCETRDLALGALRQRLCVVCVVSVTVVKVGEAIESE
jgi:hypothetical protein